MPIIQSAKKRARQEVVRRERNVKTKREIKSALKALEAAIAKNSPAEVSKAMTKVQSTLDTAVKKNLIHKNKAARKKSQASKLAKTVLKTKDIKPSAKKPTAKPAAKKTSPTKKPAAKKAPAKKPAAKK